MTRVALAMLGCVAGCVVSCIVACGGAAASRSEASASPPRAVDTTMFNANQVRGRLDPEQIRAVVVEHIDLFGKCYDEGRHASPKLQGKVTVKFEIGPNGIVTKSADARSDLPDAAVVQCVIDACRTLRFPRPEAGVVTVYFPLIFNPRD
jgi:hypothetical protein